METQPDNTHPTREPSRQESQRNTPRTQRREGVAPFFWIIGILVLVGVGVFGSSHLFNKKSGTTETVEAKAEENQLEKLQTQIEEMQRTAAEKESEGKKELDALKKQLAEAKKPAPAPAPAPVAQTTGAFHPAPAENRFFVDPAEGKKEGNPDGSLFVQASPDAGILRPFPAIVLEERLSQDPKAQLKPEHESLRQKLIAAAKAQGMEPMCLGNQNAKLESYQLCEWPAEGGAVLLAVLKSPNVAAIRHKDTPVGGGKPPR